MVKRTQITVSGTVQGVGFRPYVYNLAKSCGLSGFVTNTSSGVKIEIEGEETDSFIERLLKNPPPLSHIDNISSLTLAPNGSNDFKILESVTEASAFTMLSPDISICEDCLRELFTPSDRRYLYPFINCTNCGPRYTITKTIPYDRVNTTMSDFTMCNDCQYEYDDPENRRFHAEPNACPRCGPSVEFLSVTNAYQPAMKNPITNAIEYLKAGAILAVKGLGGYHLCCDALNEDAVNRLRSKKRKGNKPFAMMSPDVAAIEEFAHVSVKEREMLESPQRPVVLLKKKTAALPFAVSGQNMAYGFLLPYTPLHYLLFYRQSGFSTDRQPNFKALVMTSGNLSGEPIIFDNEEALQKLFDVADAFVIHNRDIHMGIDDSVLSVRADNTVNLIRRARGFVPSPIILSHEGPEVIAYGGDIKNTFTLTKGRYAIQGPHTGDMEHIDTIEFFKAHLKQMTFIYNVEPVYLACDMHPGYFSSSSCILNPHIEKTTVQHHHAHFGSVAAEHNLRDKAIGVLLDGTGFGTDGNMWGGEFLIADVYDFKRIAHFKYVPLPGGSQAIKEPRRMAVSYISDVFKKDAPDVLNHFGFMDRHGREFIENLMRIIPLKEFSPMSSSAGRLFDAVSSMLSLTDINTFEAEAALALESIIDESHTATYPFQITTDGVIDFSLTISAIVTDILNSVDKGKISAAFHNTVVAAICETVNNISIKHNIGNVVLSGGTFQNAFLINKTTERLKSAGLNVYVNEKVPCNDGGLSLGQAYIVRERAQCLSSKHIRVDNYP
ncbi:carbamoyltransferase HypF [Candidatus Magnetomonas plexicatena]|uniref:carbamoyltransferase HypF n=1 Tax=Candidatus Magnetomonas plexicatena TaxID=2552947 RepID=UPI001C7715EE|nr:carbamoyltransferase HypF [Nitrospirales bacterium LBB_01]